MPRFLLGAVVLFWGWQTGLWVFALPIALILEAPRFVEWQWDLKEADFRRLFNLSFILLVILFIYLMRTDRSMYFIYGLMQWLPALFFPLVAAQNYATCDRINLWSLLHRKSTKAATKAAATPVRPWLLNLNYPYVGLCIVAASAANTEGFLFYSGMVGLFALLLWSIRPRRSSVALWACLFLLATGTGFVGQLGLHHLHVTVEQRIINWLGTWDGKGSDPYRKTTNIGDTGVLKRSDAIAFRVDGADRQQFPMLLRETTFNKYQAKTWLAIASEFTVVSPADNGTTWQLDNPTANSSAITVTADVDRGQGFLTLPDGAFRLDQLSVSKLERNQYGTFKLETSHNDLNYQIQFDPRRSADSAPTDADLQIPPQERPALDTIVKQLDLIGKSPEEILKRVDRFFQTQFTYSLTLSRSDQPTTPLADFLLVERSGHCEYFATATTLLLRAAGIPARYATGFYVHEFSRWENQYIVRKRNAHAWTLAYVNGRWQAFDTTPPSWPSQEDGAASGWQWVADFWSFASFKLSQGLRQLGNFIRSSQWWWFVVPVALLMFRQFRQTKRVQRLDKQSLPPIAIAPSITPGQDSAFYLIEQAIADMGLARDPAESLKTWVTRLSQHLSATQIDDLQTLIELHYRYRFDPQATDATTKTRLKELSESWLQTVRP